MLSCIVTTYNRADRIRLCIHALLCQTSGDFEIIVVDDGSTDLTLQQMALSVDCDPIDTYYIWQQKRGFRLSAARNAGARLARGDGFIFIDADILLNPKAIESYQRLLLENPDRVIGGYYKYLKGMVIHFTDIREWDRLWAMELPEVDIPQHNYQMLGTDVREAHFKGGWAAEDQFADESRVWKAPFSLLGGNMMIPRHIWERTEGFDEKINFYGGEDAEFSLQLAQLGVGFSYARSVGGGHMAHGKYPGAEQSSNRALDYIKQKWPKWFPNGEPLWANPGWEVPR